MKRQDLLPPAILRIKIGEHLFTLLYDEAQNAFEISLSEDCFLGEFAASYVALAQKACRYYKKVFALSYEILSAIQWNDLESKKNALNKKLNTLMRGKPNDDMPEDYENILYDVINHGIEQEYTLPPKPIDNSGFIYVIRSDRYYKIGKSINPYRRLSVIAVSHTEQLEIVILLKTNNMPLLENVLHKTFRHKRVKGEWFNLDEDDLNYIRNLGDTDLAYLIQQ